MKKNKYFGEVRASQESRNIYGQAVTFETESTGLPWIEVIHKGAITEDTIKRSDIVFTYNHNRDQILARSYMGEGSLNIVVKDDGVYFDFDAPETRFGDEILTQIRRGDLMRCSFCFTISNENDSIKQQRMEDGTKHVDIYKIDELFDLSVVVDPAYSSTFISNRSAQYGNDEETNKKESMKEDELEEKVLDEKEKEQETEEKVEQEEIQEEETEKEEVKEEEEDEEEKARQEGCSNEEEKEQRNSIIKSDKKFMEKKFNLLRAIRSIANNQKLDEVDAAVINEGANQFRKSGVEFGGQIQLPNMIEKRAAITVTAEGEDVVATDIYDILTPLRARNVLVQAGAKFMTGLVGNVQVPVMSASNVAWELETGSATDGAGSFSHVSLTPHRLTAYVDISKQFLAQDGVGAEAVIREDIIKAINSKLEATILGGEDGKDGNNNQIAPAGMFYGASPVAVSTYAALAGLEADVEDANVLGECKYVMNPNAKAALRTMIKGENGTGMVFEGGEVDGTPALITTNAKYESTSGSVTTLEGNIIYGDWSNLAIGQWGAINVKSVA